MGYSNHQTREQPFIIRYLADLSRYRHLCWNLVGSDLRSRFRRSRLGILWAIIQPLAFALIIAFVYGQLFGQKSYWTYAIYVFSGMLVWEMFGTVANVSLDAFTSAEGYLRQARIPFLIFQARVPLSAVVIFAAGYVGLIVVQLSVGQLPAIGFPLLLVPLYPIIALFFLMPFAIAMSIIGTQFRDVKYITIIVLQLLYFLSPVMLTKDFLASPHLVLLKYINPVYPLVELFRGPAVYGQLWPQEGVMTLVAWSGAFWIFAFALAVRFGRRIVFAI
jgi:lipopolysaccharide transport system permease protein